MVPRHVWLWGHGYLLPGQVLGGLGWEISYCPYGSRPDQLSGPAVTCDPPRRHLSTCWSLSL